MDLKIGEHEFRSQEALEHTLGTRIARTYDFTARAREMHDKEATFNDKGKQIKCTREELISYWKQRLNSLDFLPPRPIQFPGMVQNLWR